MNIILRLPQGKQKVVTLSYDDGTIFDKKFVKILDEYGLKCTFNINSGMFAKNTGERRMTFDEAKELYLNSHHEVAVHGARHLALARTPVDLGIRDIIADREALEKQFDRIVKGMAYANGSFDEEYVDLIGKCGINYARTIESSHSFDLPTNWLKWNPTCHHEDDKLIELTDKFLSIDNPLFSVQLFYLWGHSYEFNDHNNWDIIEYFAKKTSNNSTIWYATNGEIYDYVTAYKRLVFSVDFTKVYNPSVIDVWFSFNGVTYCVHSGEMLKLKCV